MSAFFKPKEEIYFTWLIEMSVLAKKSAVLMVSALKEPESVDERLDEVIAYDIESHRLNNVIVDKLNRSFITPLDREDIFYITSRLEQSLNLAKDLMDRVAIYRIKKSLVGAVEMAEVFERCISCIEKIFSQLSKIKKNQEEILLLCEEIFAHEQNSDKIYRREITNLFADCTDPLEIIKWKGIYEELEEMVDYCDEMANFMRSLVMKYA